MEPEPLEVMIATIPLIVVTGLMVLAAVWVYRMSKLRELKQRQILAMIEKGITPPPELHPVAFNGAPRRSMQEERFKSGGIMLIGLGIAVALVIGVAGGQSRVGLGVGSAIAAIGAAMIVSALLSRESDTVSPSSAVGEAREPGPAETPPSSTGGAPLA